MKTKIPQKLITLLFLISCVINSQAQKKWDTKEQNYSGGVSLSGIIDLAQSKVLGLKPTGKDVSVKYDPFYNTYTINWMEEDGAARMILKFKEENSGGQMYIDKYSPNNSAYFIHNKVESDHKLTLISAEPSILDNRKVKLIIMFDDLN